MHRRPRRVHLPRDYSGGPIYLSALIALYTLASVRERRDIVVPAVLTVAALLVAGILSSDAGEAVWFHVAFISWSAAPALFIGDSARNRHAHLAGLEDAPATSRRAVRRKPGAEWPTSGYASPASCTT